MDTNKSRKIALLIFCIGTVIWLIAQYIKLSDNIIKMEIKKNETSKYNEIDMSKTLDLKYSSFINYAENNEIERIYYSELADYFYAKPIGSNMVWRIQNPQYAEFKKDMLENGIEIDSMIKLSAYDNDDISNGDMSVDSNITNLKGKQYLIVITGLVMIIASIVLIQNLRENHSFSLDKINIHRKKAKAQAQSKTFYSSESDECNVSGNEKYFSDIAGLKEVKKDLLCIVDFLKNREKYEDAGAKLPKGIILYGPPGTGKTLLAKAIANEADVPFLFMSGSDFVEKYVGVGAKRVRNLFDKAKKQAPCIIFIDEIDAIGGRRTDDESSEDRKTINALLTSMDGFEETENIIVIGATNRIEDIDKALLRPGRFNDKYCVPLPESPEEREEVFRMYIKNKRVADNVDIKSLAKETIGFSPADIENLLNEAAIIQVQDGRNFIDKNIVNKAMMKIMLNGHIKEDQSNRDKEELEIVAWHEAGHALVGVLTGKDVTKVSILSSTSGAGGVTFSTPKKERLHSLKDLKDEVMELYGGRCAELIYFDDHENITTGASNDIDRATGIIKDIVMKFAMTDEYGLLNIGKLGLDQDLIISKEIELSKELYYNTLKLIENNRDILEKIVSELLEKNTINKAELEKLIFSEEDNKCILEKC